MKKYICMILILSIMIPLFACKRGKVTETRTDPAESECTAVEVNTVQTPPRPPIQEIGSVPADISKILEKGYLVFGFIEHDRPPFYMDNEHGEFYGIDVAIAKDIAKELGVKAVFDRTSATYAELYQKIINGEIDIVAAKFSRTLSRALYINYTEPYAEFGRTIMLSKREEISLGIGDNPIPYLRNNSVKIAVIRGTSFLEYAKDMFPLAELVEFGSIEEGIGAVINSEVMAFLYDELEFARQVSVSQDILLYTSIYIIDDMKENICMALPMQNSNLCRWLNIYMQNKNIVYTLDKMMEEYPEIFFAL